MYTLAELKSGRAIVIDDDPYLITKNQFSKQGRQGGVMACKLKNLKTGAVIQKTFQGSDKFPPADIGYRHVQFLFKNDENCTFMDLESYDQFELSNESVGDDTQYLSEGLELDVLLYEENPIAVKVPVSVDLTVQETTPGVKGDTATGGTKPATFETGLTVQVPLFINEGDMVKINTERCEYVERV